MEYEHNIPTMVASYRRLPVFIIPLPHQHRELKQPMHESLEDDIEAEIRERCRLDELKYPDEEEEEEDDQFGLDLDLDEEE